MIVVHQNSRATLANGTANAEALEREIRIGLPFNSSLPTVKDFLIKRGIEFSFEGSSQSVYAVARKLKGSTSLTGNCTRCWAGIFCSEHKHDDRSLNFW